MFTHTMTVKDVYGKTEEELQSYLLPNQRFTAFRPPQMGEEVLLLVQTPRVCEWESSNSDPRIARLIVETTKHEVREFTEILPCPAYGKVGQFYARAPSLSVLAIGCDFNNEGFHYRIFELTKG